MREIIVVDPIKAQLEQDCTRKKSETSARFRKRFNKKYKKRSRGQRRVLLTLEDDNKKFRAVYIREAVSSNAQEYARRWLTHFNAWYRGQSARPQELYDRHEC